MTPVLRIHVEIVLAYLVYHRVLSHFMYGLRKKKTIFCILNSISSHLKASRL